MGKEGHVALDDIEVYSDNCATFEEQGERYHQLLSVIFDGVKNMIPINCFTKN